MRRIEKIFAVIKMNLNVRVHCADCRHRWLLAVCEIPLGGVPTCPECNGTGVAVDKAREGETQDE